jgi:hypothetical protein
MYMVSPLALSVYRYGLITLVLLGLAISIHQTRMNLRKRSFTVAQLTFAYGLLLIICFPLLPTWINHAALFAERTGVLCVLLILAAASGLNLRDRSSAVLLAGAGVSIAALATLQMAVGPAARRVAMPDRLRATEPVSEQVLMSAMNTPVGLTFDPCRTAGVRLIQQEKGIWFNPSLLDSNYMMLRRRGEPAPLSELLASDRPLTFVLVHCGGPDAGLTLLLESRFPGKWTVSRGAWANIFRPARKPYRASLPRENEEQACQIN